MAILDTYQKSHIKSSKPNMFDDNLIFDVGRTKEKNIYFWNHLYHHDHDGRLIPASYVVPKINEYLILYFVRRNIYFFAPKSLLVGTPTLCTYYTLCTYITDLGSFDGEKKIHTYICTHIILYQTYMYFNNFYGTCKVECPVLKNPYAP